MPGRGFRRGCRRPPRLPARREHRVRSHVRGDRLVGMSRYGRL